MKREYSDQFKPKWNSCTIPVTTPASKIDDEDRAPELRHAFIGLFAAGDIFSFDDGDEN